MENNEYRNAPAPRRLAARAGIALCWFLAGMLALSYLSRSVSQALMARVEIGYPGATVLDESVEGTGVWAAGETQLYTAAYARRIAKIYVQPGESVTAGQALFAYDVSDLTGGRYVTDRNVRYARRALERAEKAREGAADPVYAQRVWESAVQALAYAEFAYAQDYALQNGGVVRASFSGLVVKCELSAGKAPAAGTAGFEIAPAGLAFTLSVPEADAQRLAPGDEVTLYTDGREDAQTLRVATRDVPDEKGLVRLVCAGDGGGEHRINQTQAWKIKKQSQRYSQTIPLAALRQGGAEDYYVLVPEEKETILGTQLVARRQAVTLLAHDGRSAAIESTLAERTRLITASTKGLKDGDYVVLDDGN